MIAKLKGKIDELKPTEVIIDVNGVGYQLFIPLTTYERIQKQQDVSLHVFTLHKEDQMRLFGFFTKGEKEIFQLLLNISGIGPAMALSVLSGIRIEILVEAVKTGNTSLLTGIPGIGKSKAEKLVFELKRKLKKLEAFADPTPRKPSVRNEAIEAMMSLGFDEAKSSKAVDEIIDKFPEITLELAVKNALKSLAG